MAVAETEPFQMLNALLRLLGPGAELVEDTVVLRLRCSPGGGDMRSVMKVDVGTVFRLLVGCASGDQEVLALALGESTLTRTVAVEKAAVLLLREACELHAGPP